MFACVVIALVVVVAYANSFSGAMVLDDDVWIVSNPAVHHLWPLGNVLFPDSRALGGRPLVNLTLAINYALDGTQVWGYHAVNLAFHILAAWTLFGFVRRTLLLPKTRDRFGAAATPLALAIALLWAVHPLQTAAVTYIVQRTEVMVGLFYLVTMYCTLRGATIDPDRAGSKRRRLWWYLAAIVACALGMATKEVMVTAPLVLLLYDRAFLAGSFGAAFKERRGLYLCFAATWSFVAWALVSSDFHAGTTGFGVSQFTWWTYLRTQPGVLWHYLTLAVWPDRLNLDYAWPTANSVGEILLPAIPIIGLLGLTSWLLVRRPMIGFLGAWAFLILAPTSSFVPLKDAAFDHRMYLPLAAVAALVVLAVYRLWVRVLSLAPTGDHGLPLPKWTLPVAALVVVCLAFCGLTAARNADFRSRLAILTDIVAKSPWNARAHVNLAEALSNQGQFNEAIEQASRAVEIQPDFAEARANLSQDLARTGKIDEAIAQSAEAVRLKPDSPKFRVNFANTLASKGDFAGAVRQCEEAIKLDSKLLEPHLNLAVYLSRLGKPEQAVEEARKAVELSPNSAAAHHNLAGLLAQQGNIDEAIEHCQRAIELDPTDVGAHSNLGKLFVQRRQGRDAVAQFRVAATLQPNQPVLLDQLAWQLATNSDREIRDGAQAVRLAQQAVNLTRAQDAGSLDVLAAAYAEVGQFDAAAKVAQRALAIAKALKNEPLIKAVSGRLALYQSDTAYHE